jgi:hypothetical protein
MAPLIKLMWVVSISVWPFCHQGEEPPTEQETGWALDVSEKTKTLLTLQLVHEIFCFMTNCNLGTKFGSCPKQVLRGIYRPDRKGVNGELRNLQNANIS